ncbi:MAG TPA: hypothetical protein P5228_12085 [Bacteroidales bacterium]|nr:hypothetical protein [Bacteroidales bacterium]HRZ48055.1 hypothetical protein [Bacteroidales bacterium]
MKTIQITLQEQWAAMKHKIQRNKKRYWRKKKHKKREEEKEEG